MNDPRDPVNDPSHPFVYIMRRPQIFRNGHPLFFLCQQVQPLQRIFHISLSDQPLPIPF